ncbi:MAG: host specificity factor TipJ family phage tail protein [Phycisphaerales bacterium]
MRRLAREVPSWVKSYIGIEFAERGLSRDEGLSCWGLYRLASAEQFGCYLPSHCEAFQPGDVKERRKQIAAVIQDRIASRQWRHLEVGEIQTGDLALFRVSGAPHHVGMVVAQNRMLHADRDVQSCVQRMDAPEWEPRFLGFYRYEGPVRVAGRPMFLRDDQVDVAIPAGKTIAELLAIAGIQAPGGIHVHVGGTEIPPDRWHLVKPKPGRIVQVTATPGDTGGGGKSPLKTILTIAILAGSIAAPYALAGLGATSLLTTAGGLTLSGALLSAGVGIGGTLLISALIPPPSAQLSAIAPDNGTTTSLAISGGRNEARPHGAVPIVLGEYVITPLLAATPYTEIVGNDQYLRMLFNCGYGPLEISEIKIGDTDINQFDGVQLQVLPGRADDPPPSLYPSIVHEQPYSVLVDAAGGSVIRTTEVDADEVTVDLLFAQGLVQILDDGSKANRAVTMQVEFSPAGANAWQGINAASPLVERGLDVLFRGPEVVFAGSGIHAGAVGWGAGYPFAKPAYLPANRFSWECSGWVFCPVAGEYSFSVEGSDACDLAIDSKVIVSQYGQHAAGAIGTHHGEITLTKGWHAIRGRVEARSGNGGLLLLGWKPPSAGGFALIPAASFAPSAVGGPLGQLNYRWFDTSSYNGTFTVTAARAEPMRFPVGFAAARGQYDVRITRISADTTDARILDKAYLSAIRSFRAETPVKMAGVAMIALRIKATNQLNGVVDTLSCRARSILPDWDKETGTWIERATSSPASCYRAVAQGPANKRPLADSGVDLQELAAWHEECEDAGFECNVVIDFRGTVADRLKGVASTGRGLVGRRNGKLSVIRDRVQSVPIQHFTPRNSRNFKGTKVFADVPHGWRIQFTNADRNYIRDERIVLADGYQIDGKDAFGNPAPTLPPAEVFETMEFFGVVHADEVWKHGRYFIAVAKLRPELYQFETDIEHLACTQGDLVFVTHDVPLFGNGYGRVVRQILDTQNNLRGLLLDAKVVMEAGKTYVLRCRLPDGTSFLKYLQTAEGESNRVDFVGPISPGEARPNKGDLFMFGELGSETRELIVKSIVPDADLAATIVCVDAAPEVLLADQGTIPDYNPGITVPPEYLDRPEAPIIDQILSDDYITVRGQDGSLMHRMLIVLRSPSGTKPRPVTAQVRLRPKPRPPADAVGPWDTRSNLSIDNTSVSVMPVEAGVTYQISIRVISAAGVASTWTDAEHTVIGNIIPPPDVQAFDVYRLSDGTRCFTWKLGTVPRDIAGVQLRYGPQPGPGGSLVWESMQDLHDGLLEGASPAELNVPPQGAWRFAIKMVDTAGAESVNALYCDRELGAPRQPEVAITQDARKLGWPGTLTGCHITSDGVLEADDRATWANLASVYGITKWSQFTRWSLDPVNPISYEHPVIDIGVLIDFEPQATCQSDGTAFIEVRHSADGVDFTDWADVTSLASRSVRARFVQFRVTVTQVPAEIPTIREFVMIPRAETVEEYLNDVNTALQGPRLYYGPGDIALPISQGLFAKIKSVSVTFNGTGAGWTWELVNKSGLPGPRVRLYNPQGVLADALIDANVRGLKSIDGSTAVLASGRMQFNDLVNSGMLATL